MGFPSAMRILESPRCRARCFSYSFHIRVRIFFYGHSFSQIYTEWFKIPIMYRILHRCEIYNQDLCFQLHLLQLLRLIVTLAIRLHSTHCDSHNSVFSCGLDLTYDKEEAQINCTLSSISYSTYSNTYLIKYKFYTQLCLSICFEP